MATITQGNFAKVLLNKQDVLTVTGGATVDVIWGASPSTATVSTSQVFGPYGYPVKLRITATSGSVTTSEVSESGASAALSQSGGAIATFRKIKATISEADAKLNPIQALPLLAPAAWGAGTFFAGEVVANGANAYVAMNNNAASATIPSGQSPYTFADGSQAWTYYGSSAADPSSDVVSTSHGAINAAATRAIACVSAGQPDASKFNFLGGGATVVGAYGGGGSMLSTKVPNTPGGSGVNFYDCNIQGMEFMTDSRVVAIGQTTGGPNQFYKFKLTVDNKPLTKGILRPAAGAPATSGVNVVFTGRRERRIAQYSSVGLPFQKVWVEPGANVWAPENPNRWTLMVNGCSLDDQGFYAVPDNAWPTQVAKRLGCDSIVSISKAGTGILNPGATYKYDVRLQDMITRGIIPDVYVFGNFVNDTSYAGYSSATFQAAIVSHITQARAGFGAGVPIIVTGLMGGNTGPDAATIAAEGYVLAAVNTYLTTSPGDSLVKFIPISTDPKGPWLEGNGTLGGAAGTVGNADYYVGLAPHLGALGNDYIAQKFAAAIKGALLSMALAAGV